MTRDGLTEENLRDGSVKDISHRSRGRPENKEEFVPERERKKAEWKSETRFMYIPRLSRVGGS